MDHSLFSRSPVKEYLGCFQDLTTTNYIETNTFVRISFISSPLCTGNGFLEVGLLRQKAIARVILLDTTKLPARGSYTVCIPADNI